MLLSFFFLFKQKTAYEMRISDWSSDVCSSDLRRSPVSVSESRRDVRWNNVAPMLLSRRDIAFDTVALERPSALAAAVKERCSTTAANMAQASKSDRKSVV